ncbi:MAG: Gx transporter family protein [Coriobacteriia bacterium]
MQSRAEASRVAWTASFLALACSLGLLESLLLPPLPVPGLKLGLANLAVLAALVTLGPARALMISLGRVVIVGLATGGLLGPVGLLSLAGAVFGWAAMAGARHFGRTSFSVVGLSLAGACAHVIGQLTAACALTGSIAPLYLTPLSLGLGILSGLAIGYSARLLLSRVPSPVISFAS